MLGRFRAEIQEAQHGLNRAARVMACGHGGQILLDGGTVGLVSGVDLVDLGPRRLRDLARLSPAATLPTHSNTWNWPSATSPMPATSRC